MLKIAITGGIACGKSRVGSFLAEQHVAVCDADDLAHEVTRAGRPVYYAVISKFGDEIVGEGGEIDRQRLGNIVFSDPRKLSVLNSIVHPAVKSAWRKWLSERGPGTDAAAIIVPLLFETNEAQGWDAVVCVSASESVQVRRLAGRGISEADARKRFSAQMALSKKMECSDYVIHNDGSEGLLREQTRRVVEYIGGIRLWDRT
jgi:dephospho-CoA kinase